MLTSNFPVQEGQVASRCLSVKPTMNPLGRASRAQKKHKGEDRSKKKCTLEKKESDEKTKRKNK